MVNVYCHDHATDEGRDCHLGSKFDPAPHQKELFHRIEEACHHDLPDPYYVEPTSHRAFKVVDEERRATVFCNYYESDVGYRVKITPYEEEFFEDVFRPLVEDVPIPDKVDTTFKWEAGLLDSGITQPCTMCGREIGSDDPILWIKAPDEVQAGEIVEEKLDVDAVDFRACFECADAEEWKSAAESELTFIGDRFEFFADEEWLLNL